MLEQRAPGTKSKVKYLLSDPKLELEDLADIEEVLKTCSPEKVIEQLEEFGYTIN
ncbi:MAG: hypothetical protein QXH30_00220 [Candidatus Bilamarchaeaceae archaeon]